jgi:hypothetical protein
MFDLEERSSAVSLFDRRPPFLADVAKRYQVCWEVWPEYSTIGGQERQTGFELELSGTHESATQHMGPRLSSLPADLQRTPCRDRVGPP